MHVLIQKSDILPYINVYAIRPTHVLTSVILEFMLRITEQRGR